LGRLAAVVVAGIALAALPAVAAVSQGAARGDVARAPDTDSGPAAVPAPTVKAWSGILVDRRSGVVLWKKYPSRRLATASLAKIMTALVVLERVDDLGRYARVPKIPLPQTVGVGLRPGDRITVRQALRALMVKSANDAALTLAHHVAGGEAAFVRLMNVRAARMGLGDTRYRNCRGADQAGQYTCARDLAVLARVAMRDARFRELAALQTATIRYPPDHAVVVTSHNRLLDYAWADGVKTGSTSAAGRCLVGSGKPGLVPLLTVTMHEPTRDQELADTLDLFAWGSAQYQERTLVSAGDIVTSAALAGGGRVALAAESTRTAVVRTDATVTVDLDVPATLAALPADGAVIGTATYRSDGLRLRRISLLAAGLLTPSPSPVP
jgi:D-alanyl-D-alanine carboxypeptidase (penicillin-binding protein 5/6)